MEKLHIAMFPWFAMDHLTSFLHLSNKLASKGHQISFFSPSKTILKLTPFNLHPQLITFIPIPVPQVPGLPSDAETTYDVPHSLSPLILTAMDLTYKHLEVCLQELNPHFVFFDFANWVPSLARGLGVKSVHYSSLSSAFIGYVFGHTKPNDPMKQPVGFPSSSIKLYKYEADLLNFLQWIVERYIVALNECDAIAFSTCREMEGQFCDYVEKVYRKPVFLSGPIVPNTPSTESLEERWAKWLDGFKPNSVVYCSFGSECILKKEEIRELLLGLELSGYPFLVALKKPEGIESIEEALPDGFEERVRGRGVVHSGRVQQQLILGHPSVGCFVTHCGSGSLSEALVKECQLVLLPYVWDEFVNARLMSRVLKVGVEVDKREEDGWFSREGVCKAVELVMDEGSEVGREVRANHAKLRELLISEGFECSYIESFVNGLKGLLG